MGEKWVLFVFTLLLSITYSTPSWAGKILDKIQETGVINAGARKDSIPFGYVNKEGEWVGYSLDILELIRQQTETKLGKPIKLNLVEVNPETRFSGLKQGQIEIECGSTTFTWERETDIDFAMSYFASGTQMLVKKGSGIGSIPSLAGKKIGVVPNTTNERVIKTFQPEAILVLVSDRTEGWQKLQQGEIEGFASDGILLEGIRLTAPEPDQYEIVPEYPYMLESYACSLPQDESQWRDLVNYTIIQFMEGIISDNNNAVTIYERWFGSKGVTPYPREQISDYFRGIVDSVEWIPLTGRY